MEFFLARGLDINSRNFEERTPLHFAAEMGEKEMLLFLLNKSADWELAESKNGMIALDFVDLQLRTMKYLHRAAGEKLEEIALVLRKKWPDGVGC